MKHIAIPYCLKYSLCLIILCTCFSPHVNSQTCCSGGIPVSNHLGFQSTEANMLQLSLSADFNFLKTLYNERDILDDQLRKRTTQSFIFRGSYSFNERISGEVFIPFIRQTRTIYQTGGDIADFDESIGFGDPVSLFMYRLIESPFIWRIGAGLQFPLGSTSMTNDQGLFLVEDLQPGSGSLDLILFHSLELPLSFRPTALWYLNTVFQSNGTNSQSRGGVQSYRFGNDLQFITGITDQFMILNLPTNIGTKLRYRRSSQDRVNENLVPGTGGNWLFVGGSVGVPLARTTILNLNFEIPVYTRVTGTQLSPDYVFNIGLYKKIDLSNKFISEFPNN